MSTEDNIPSQIKFTNADVNASKVTRMNKKTASDGTHIGWSVHVIDGDVKHYDNKIDYPANANKAAVKQAIKDWLLTITKKLVPNPTNTSIASALSQDSDGNDIPESL